MQSMKSLIAEGDLIFDLLPLSSHVAGLCSPWPGIESRLPDLLVCVADAS